MERNDRSFEMNKHTPGPWSVGVPGPNGCPTIGTNYGLMTAMIAHSRNEPDQIEVCNANANLIAAAPDLLEALEIVKNATIDIDSSGSWGSIHVTVEDWNIIKSAIARAKGESK